MIYPTEEQNVARNLKTKNVIEVANKESIRINFKFTIRSVSSHTCNYANQQKECGLGFGAIEK